MGSLDGEPARATQDIAPRVRRFVVRRDRGLCRMPGCRSAANLELHHIVPRSSGGSHQASNLIQLCDGCHTAHHRGLLDIHGTSDDLVVTRRHVFEPAELDPDGAHVDVDAIDCAHMDTSPIDHAHVDAAPIDRTHVGARHRPGVFDRVAARTQALDALVTLGFKRHEARTYVDGAIDELGHRAADLETLLRTALQRVPR